MGWWSKWRKKILGAVAAVVGGPVGLIIGLAIQLLPDGPGQKSSFQNQFSNRVEALLNTWLDSRLEKWFVAKMSVFKNKNTRQQLMAASGEVNTVLREMASVLKYYEYMSTKKGVDQELYAAKAIVIQDAIIEISTTYKEAIKEVSGKIYLSSKSVKTVPVSNGPDQINWNGQSFTIKVPHFSTQASKPSSVDKPINIPDLPPAPDILINPPIQQKPSDKPVTNCLVPPCPGDTNTTITKPSLSDVVVMKPVDPIDGRPKGTITRPAIVSNSVSEVENKSKNSNTVLKVLGAVGAFALLRKIFN